MYSFLRPFIFLIPFITNVCAADKDLLSTTTSPSQTFQLPEEVSQWREATLNYIKPWLTTSSLEEKFEELLSITMADEVLTVLNKERRERNIRQAFDELSVRNNDDRLLYLTKITGLHKIYLQNSQKN